MKIEDAVGVVGARMQAANRKERTRAEYCSEARTFAVWFAREKQSDATVRDLTVVNADEYLAALEKKAGGTLAAGTKHHRAGQLRAFTGHLASALGWPSNPLAKFSAPKPERREVGDAIGHADMLRMLEELTPPRSLVDAVTRGIVVLCYDCGPRTSETAGLQVADRLVVRAGEEAVGEFMKVSQPAKGGSERILPLGVRAGEVIDDLVGHRTSGPLFVGRRGQELSIGAIQDRMQQLGQRLGIAVSVQRLRRTSASWQSAYGAATGHLDSVFGWKPNPADVKSGHYIIPTAAQLLHAHQTLLSPLDRLELHLGEPLRLVG